MVMCYKSFNATHLVNYADKIEGVFCEICFKHEKFIVGCIHRPPSADKLYVKCVIEAIDNLCIDFPRHVIVIGGDFNFRLIDWSIPKPTLNDNQTSFFWIV